MATTTIQDIFGCSAQRCLCVLLFLGLFDVLVQHVPEVLPTGLGDQDGVPVGPLHLKPRGNNGCIKLRIPPREWGESK